MPHSQRAVATIALKVSETRVEQSIVHLIRDKLDNGGTIQVGSDGGYYIEPTIFTNVKPEMKEETFGPIVTVSKFKSEDEVLSLANDTTYGLAAGIHTKDYERAIRVTNALKACTTWVNMYNFVHWSIPLDGYKQSGLGRECGEAVLENYLETKAVFFNMGLNAPQ